MSEFISEQGRKALIKVAQWLEAGAPHVDINGRVIENFDMNIAVCGTTCCIAGAVCQFEGLGNFDPQDPAILYNDGWRGEGLAISLPGIWGSMKLMLSCCSCRGLTQISTITTSYQTTLHRFPTKRSPLV